MARFERGGQFIEYWTERPERPLDPATGRPLHAWPELISRSGRCGVAGASGAGAEPVTLPRAKTFALRTSTMTKRTLATILAAPWPMLEDLELWFGDIDRGYGAECTVADLAPLFARSLPAVRALRIMNCPFSDEAVPLIVAWPGAAQLATLDFSLGTLSDAGAQSLAGGRAAFPALQRLGVFECSLTPAGLALIADAGYPVDASAISAAESWREPQQKPGRYCSVSE